MPSQSRLVHSSHALAPLPAAPAAPSLRRFSLRSPLRPAWRLLLGLALLGGAAGWGQILGTEIGAVPAGPAFSIFNMSGLGSNPSSHSIATDGANFLVVIANTGNSESGTDIYAARVTTAGAVLDSTPIHVASDANYLSAPSVAFDGTDYVVVWVGGTPMGNDEIFAARISPAGQVLDAAPIQITSGSETKLKPVGLGFDGTNFLVAWRTTSDSLQAARFSTALANLDAPGGFAIANSPPGNYYPWVAYGGGVYLVVWHQGAGGSGGGGCSQAQGCTGSLAIYGARVTPAGQVLDPGGFAISSDPNDLQDDAAAAFDGANFLVTWHDWANSDIHNNGSVAAARVTPAGVVLDQPALTLAARALWESVAPPVFDGTDYFVVWHVDNSPDKFRNADIYGTRVSTSGQLLDEKPAPVATANGNQFGPGDAVLNGKILVTWTESVSSRCFSSPCLYGQILQESANAGSVRAALNPAPAAAGWQSVPSPVSGALNAVFGFDNTHAFAVSDQANSQQTAPSWLTYDGSNWPAVPIPGGGRLFGLWGASPNTVWGYGWADTFTNYDGSLFLSSGCGSSSLTGLSLWGADPAHLIAVGTPGAHSYQVFDSSRAYCPQNGNTGVNYDLGSVWGVDAGDAYAVGEFGAILHFDGSKWTPMSGVPTGERLNGIWGTGDADIFAVGDFGTILHYDGQSWTAQDSGVAGNLTSVWGFNGQDVYAVGFGGRILHYDGSSWIAEASPTTANLSDVSGAGNNVWAVGDAGVILQLATQGNPTPRLDALSPISVSSGTDTTLQVTGANFAPGATVRWNGGNLATTYVSATQLTAVVTAGALQSALPGTFYYPNGFGDITVVNPAPQGGISTGLVLAVGPLPSAGVSPSSLDFGAQAVGVATASQPLTLSNTGSNTLSIVTVSISGANASDFSQTNTCGSSLAAGASCSISVTFTPSAAGARSTTLYILDNASNSPQSVALTGIGGSSSVKLSAASLSFSPELTGTASSAQTITLSNAGTAALSFTGITLAGANAGDFAETNTCGSSVAVGASCSIGVTFTPSATGARTATLSLADNAPDSPQTIALSGAGADISIAPASGSSSSASVNPGQTAGYNMNFTPSAGYSGTLTLSCSGAPSEAACTVSPASLALSNGGSGSATVSVTTTAASVLPPVLPPRPRPWPPAPLAWLLAGLLAAGLALSRRKSLRLAALACLLAAAIACGGPSSPPPPVNPGTPAGTYTLTVTATASTGGARTVALTLTVN